MISSDNRTSSLDFSRSRSSRDPFLIDSKASTISDHQTSSSSIVSKTSLARFDLISFRFSNHHNHQWLEHHD